MKKQSIFTLVALVAIFMFASCDRYEAKKVDLKTQNDSLNYTLGLANGDGIKNYYMKTDSSSKPIIALMKAMDKAFNSKGDQDAMYKLGVQIGNSFKLQKAKGLMNDSTLKFDEALVKQGMINALNGYDKGMTAKEAQDFIQKTMTRIQSAKMPKPAPTPAPAPAQEPAKQEVK